MVCSLACGCSCSCSRIGVPCAYAHQVRSGSQGAEEARLWQPSPSPLPVWCTSPLQLPGPVTSAGRRPVCGSMTRRRADEHRSARTCTIARRGAYVQVASLAWRLAGGGYPFRRQDASGGGRQGTSRHEGIKASRHQGISHLKEGPHSSATFLVASKLLRA